MTVHDDRTAAGSRRHRPELQQIAEGPVDSRLDALTVDVDRRAVPAVEAHGCGQVGGRRLKVIERRQVQFRHADGQPRHQTGDPIGCRRPHALDDGDGQMIGLERREPYAPVGGHVGRGPRGEPHVEMLDAVDVVVPQAHGLAR